MLFLLLKFYYGIFIVYEQLWICIEMQRASFATTFRNGKMMFDLKFSLNGKWSLNGEWLLNALQTYLKTQFYSFMCSMTLKARKSHNGRWEKRSICKKQNYRFQMENTNSIVADAQQNIETSKFIGIKRINIFKSRKRVHSHCAKPYKNVDRHKSYTPSHFKSIQNKAVTATFMVHGTYINIFTYYMAEWKCRRQILWGKKLNKKIYDGLFWLDLNQFHFRS